MPSNALVQTPQAAGLNALKNISTQDGCSAPNRPYMKAANRETKTVYFIRPDCKSWSCAYCAERRRRLWVFNANFGGDRLLREGLELSFVTLTSHEVVRSVLAGVEVWRKAWPKLSARWRRRSPGAQYFYVGEHKRAQNFHVHMVTSAGIEARWYKDNARQCGLGYQADVVQITRALECGVYMGKYLGKALFVKGWPKGWRRVNTSQRWPKPEASETPYDWVYLGKHPSKAQIEAAGYRRMGWTIATSLPELT